MLAADDTARVIVNSVTQPRRAAVSELLIRPTTQV